MPKKSKAGRKPKLDVEMTERLQLRTTAEQKALYQAVSEYTGGTVSDFVRDVMSIVSENVIRYSGGAVSPQEFQAELSDELSKYILSEIEPETLFEKPEIDEPEET